MSCLCVLFGFAWCQCQCQCQSFAFSQQFYRNYSPFPWHWVKTQLHTLHCYFVRWLLLWIHYNHYLYIVSVSLYTALLPVMFYFISYFFFILLSSSLLLSLTWVNRIGRFSSLQYLILFAHTNRMIWRLSFSVDRHTNYEFIYELHTDNEQYTDNAISSIFVKCIIASILFCIQFLMRFNVHPYRDMTKLSCARPLSTLSHHLNGNFYFSYKNKANEIILRKLKINDG